MTVGGGLCNGEGSSRGNFGRDRRYLLITAWLEAQRPVPRLIHRRADILCILFFRAFHHPPLDLSYPFFLPYFHSHPLPFFPPLLLDPIEPSRRGGDLSLGETCRNRRRLATNSIPKRLLQPRLRLSISARIVDKSVTTRLFIGIAFMETV